MTAVADNAQEIDADTQRAWSAYSERLQDLTGEEYERTEEESWIQLQGELRRIDRRRRTLSQTGM